MRSLLLPFVALALWAPHALALLYTISNNCGQPINLYINGVNEGSLGINGVTTRQFANNWSGFIYTDANGGDGATGARITRAGFYGESNYYYIVIDTTRLNTGVRIEPQVPINNGFCAPDMCDNGACNSVYQFPPTDFSPPTSTPPSPPLFACPGNNVGYKVTFCPSGGFPPALDDNPVTIHPNGNTAKCLDVRGNVLANGTPVQIYDCNGTGAQKWSITAGPTTVQLFGTNFCLDAGSHPASGVGMKIWQCYEGLAAQYWTYTAKKQLQIAGTQCLDLPNGSTTNGKQVQTWQCSAGNTNQIWTYP